MNTHVFDAPVRDPDDDLLGIAPYARTLAEFIHSINPPFTIGIYGEWGSGKTSFVGFVEHYLKSLEAERKTEPITFISFTAWPYRTSEELWRALILRIAEELYGARPTSNGGGVSVALPGTTPVLTNPSSPPTDGTWRRLLTQDALVIKEVPAPADPLADYRRLVARLDGTSYGGVGNRSADTLQIDQEQLAATVARTLWSAVEAMSPIAATVRKLLGAKPDNESSSVVRRQRNETARARIESMEDFREALKNVFRERASGKRVCVFVDDLDRCMPDAALDLLEATKVFLGELPCIFVVAADERLIGQGLSLRFRDLLKDAPDAGAHAIFTQKGQEYFEKIIQLGVRVPDRTAEQTHTFIAAQFPLWLPATDIIQTAIGNNPRRIKQYCSLLRYKHMVATSLEHMAATTGRSKVERERELAINQRRSAALEKIIALYSWRPECLERVSRLAADRATYAQELKRIEDCLLDSKEDVQLPDIETRIPDARARQLYVMGLQAAPLYRLLRSTPHLSDFDPREIAVFAEFADIKPDLKRILSTRDAPLMRVIDVVIRAGKISPESVLQEDFGRLIDFYDLAPDAAKYVYAASRLTGWTTQMLAVERAVDAGKTDATELHEAAAKLVNWALAPDQPTADRDRRRMILDSPRFSAMLPGEVEAFWRLRHNVPEPQPSTKGETTTGMLPAERARRRAALLYQIVPDSTKNPLLAELELRIWAAHHFTRLRQSAKLDALAHCWPELAALLRNDRRAFTALETHIVQPGPLTGALETLWDRWQRDTTLHRFLALRPLMRDLYADEVESYFAVSHAISAPGEMKTPEVAPPPVPAPATVHGVGHYTDLIISFEPEVEAKPSSAKKSSGSRVKKPTAYKIVLEVGGERQEAISAIDWSGIHERTAALDIMARNVPIVGREVPQRRGDLMSQLRELGEALYQTALPDSLQKTLATRLADGQAYRIVWKLEAASELVGVPWEALYVPTLRMSPVLSQQFSVVRLIRTPTATPIRRLSWPLRVLAVLSNPQDVSLPGVEMEGEIIERTFKSAREEGRVKLEFLRGPQADAEHLQRILRSFRPNVLHFVGHAAFDSDRGEGALVLPSPEGARFLLASDLAVLLRDANIDFAVLNACDTATSSIGDPISSLAGSLVYAGVPAVVSTTRMVADAGALMFAREFYRTFIEGHSLEVALAEARKALSVERWDWAAYSLVTRSTELAGLCLPEPAGHIGVMA